MRIRAGWGVVAAVMATVMGVGCGRENGDGSEPRTPPDDPVMKPPVPPPPADSPEQQPGPVVDPEDEPTPTPETPSQDGWWQYTPEASPVTFEAPACVPMAAASMPRFAHACSAKEFLADGRLHRARRFDAAGNVLEDTYFSPDGTPSSSTLATYAQGREVRREVRASSDTRVTEWTYDDAGRLAHVRELSGRTPSTLEVRSESRSLYDAQGRLEREQHYRTGSDGTEEVTLQFRYLYGQTEKLEAIQTSDLGIVWFSRESFTYHPNGQLARWSMRDYNPAPYGASKEYDERGHLISSESSLDERGSRTTYAYDARGYRVEQHEVSGSSQNHSDRLTRYVYDEAGRLGAVRFTEDTEPTPGWPGTPYSRHAREVTRSFYGCSGDLLFEEQDTNEDGVRDGSHELVRDAAGNLRFERFRGSFAPGPDSITRIEYGYDGCQE